VNPVLDLPLNEGTGTTVYDRRGRNNNGTLYGPTWQKVWRDWLLRFDGIDDYVEVPDSPSLRDVTFALSMSAWVKLKLTGTWGFIMVKGAAWKVGIYEIYHNPDGYAGFLIYTQGVVYGITGTSVIADDRWHFVTGVWGKKKIYIYVDGQLENTADGPVSFPDVTTDALTIGVRKDGYPVDGLIASTHICKQALTADQIALLATLFRGEKRATP